MAGRRALEDFDFGKYVIPAGATNLCSRHVLHSNPRYFSEPKMFLPERWKLEGRNEELDFIYFPFWAGPRRCIGEHFAWLALSLVLATLIQKWQLRRETDVSIPLEMLITLRPKGGGSMQLNERVKRIRPH